jgi:hypothetical protein
MQSEEGYIFGCDAGSVAGPLSRPGFRVGTPFPPIHLTGGKGAATQAIYHPAGVGFRVSGNHELGLLLRSSSGLFHIGNFMQICDVYRALLGNSQTSWCRVRII